MVCECLLSPLHYRLYSQAAAAQTHMICVQSVSSTFPFIGLKAFIPQAGLFDSSYLTCTDLFTDVTYAHSLSLPLPKEVPCYRPEKLEKKINSERSNIPWKKKQDSLALKSRLPCQLAVIVQNISPTLIFIRTVHSLCSHRTPPSVSLFPTHTMHTHTITPTCHQ